MKLFTTESNRVSENYLVCLIGNRPEWWEGRMKVTNYKAITRGRGEKIVSRTGNHSHRCGNVASLKTGLKDRL